MDAAEQGSMAGKTAIITGASRGIGLAVAERLVSRGARVVLTARNKDGLADAVTHLGGADVAMGIAGRADDPDHRQLAVTQALEAFGSIDYLVNNTGINPVYGGLLSLEAEAARKIVEVNVIAAVGWVQAVAAAGMSENGGAIVNISSVAGLRPAPGIGMYGASKAMLTHITEELAVEMAPRVRVNGVAPAVVKTQFATKLFEHDEEGVAAQYPLQRLGLPEDIAGAVAFLLSDDAAWITGQTLVIDGGLLLKGGV